MTLKIFFFFLFLMNCGMIAPGVNETNRNYSMVFIAKNVSGASLLFQTGEDTATIENNKIFIKCNSYEWNEKGTDNDYTVMPANVISSLSYNVKVQIKNTNGIFVEKSTFTVSPTYKEGEKIKASTMDEIKINVN